MSNDALLDALVKSPRLGHYVDRLTGVLADERLRRERFYDEMNEQVKQEFILLEGDHYSLQLKVNSGTLRSQVVPGFEIPVRAIFDEQENLSALKALLAN